MRGFWRRGWGRVAVEGWVRRTGRSTFAVFDV